LAHEHEHEHEHQLHRIEASLQRIEASIGRTEKSAGLSQGALERILNTMPTQKELDDLLDAIAAQVTQVGTDVQAVMKAIKDKAAAGQDFSAEITKGTAIATALSQVDADALAQGDPIAPPTP